MQKLRQVIRSLMMRPMFTILVVVIMGLCIGGNASVFSAAKTILFQDLPYADGDELVVFSLRYLPTGTENDLSWAEVRDFEERVTRLEQVSGFLAWQSRLLAVGDTVEQIGVNFVEPSHLHLLGVKPHLGRLFNADENDLPGSAPVALISHELWDRVYNEDPAIVGQVVELDDNPYTVIGVLPEGFFDVAEWRWDVDAWLPAVQAGETFGPDANIFEVRNSRSWYGLGRLADGVSPELALEELNSIAAQLEQEYPETNEDFGAALIPMREFLFGDLHSGMRILLAGAILVLFIGCANIASILLVRVVERRSELSLRLALGAGRGELIRQVLAESLVLAAFGGVLGVALAYWGTAFLNQIVQVPNFATVELDGMVLTVIVLVSVLTGILFGLPPAFGATRMEAKGALIQKNRSAGGGGQGARGRSALLVFQVAILTVLLVVAGLLLRSFLELKGRGVDFDTEQLLTLRLSFATEDYSDRQNIVLAEKDLLQRLEGLPGVESAAVWGPGMPGIESPYVTIERRGATEEEPKIRAFAHAISAGAIETLGMDVLAGRDFDESDTPDRQRSVIVTQSVAESAWPGEDPVGRELQRVGRPNEPGMLVVGVIPNSKLHGRFSEGTNQILFTHQQRPMSSRTLLVRTAGDPLALVDPVRDTVRSVNSRLPIYDIATLDSRLYREEGAHRLNAAIVTMYSVLALIFAVLGLYGTLSYFVLQRTQEIGVRVALGARPAQIVKLVTARGLAMVGGGVLLGVGGAFFMTHLLESLLYGVGERDPTTFALVVLIFAVVAVVATLLPALRALRVEPNDALRFD